MSRIEKASNVSTSVVSTSTVIPRVATVSFPPIEGSLAYNTPDDNIYYADGVLWHKLLNDQTVLAGDVTGPYNANTVVKIQNQSVPAGTVSGQILEFLSPNSWVLNSNLSPANGNLLMWSGTRWVPVGGTPSAGQVPIATSATSFTWGTLPPPAANANAFGAFAMFYGLTAGTGNTGPTDYAATVAVKTAAGTGRVPFPRNGPVLGGIVRVDASSFTLPAVGTYEVSFEVHTTEPGQLQLELQGADLPETVAVNMNPTSGGHPIVCKTYITTGVINSVLAVVNCVGNSTALTITPADGANTHANAQRITIARIA